MEAVARNFRTNMLIGSALAHKGYDINAALLISPQGEWKSGYQKTKLVPFSEYTPHDPLSQRIAGVLHLKSYNFLSGKGYGVLSLEEGFKDHAALVSRLFGVLICSEEAYPALVRELARRQVSFIVVMLNDGWFRQKEALMMHAQNAVFRAVEAGVTVARDSNTGYTVVFGPNGRKVRARYPPLNNAGFAVVDIPVVRQRTAYVMFGDIFVWACVAFVIMTTGYALARRRLFLEKS
jgi:apolipoprotein N-acyltransferase